MNVAEKAIHLSPGVKKILLAILPIAITAFAGFVGWSVKAWADDRYAKAAELDAAVLEGELSQKEEQIEDLDDTLFEIDQELLFVPPDSSDARKYRTIKEHYVKRKAERLREREKIMQELDKLPPDEEG